jgi:peptide/nickel transport system substrate-binding protein
MRDLLAQLRRETDFARRYELFGRVQALFWEDVPAIKFGDRFLLHIHRSEVMGFAAMPANFFWNVWLERR